MNKCDVCGTIIEDEDDVIEYENEIWCPECFWEEHYVAEDGSIKEINETS